MEKVLEKHKKLQKSLAARGGLEIKAFPDPPIEEQNLKVKELRGMIEASKELDDLPRSDYTLLRFLTVCDWNTCYAFKRFRRYYRFRKEKPSFFYRDPVRQHDDLFTRESCFLLDGRDKYGRRVYYIRAEKLDPMHCSMENQALFDSLWFEAMMDDPENLRKGIPMIMDCKNCSMKLIRWYTPSNMVALSKFAETAPMKCLEVNVVNTSPVLNLMIRLLFPLLGNFVKERFFFHFNDYDSLASRLGKEVLPPNLGGLGPEITSEYHEKAKQELYETIDDVHRKMAIKPQE